MSTDNLFQVIFLTAMFFIVIALLTIFFNVPSWIVRPISWAFVLAILGFTFGIFGPSLLLEGAKPSAGLLGIVAAAYAAIFGALIGLISAQLHLGTGQNLIALAITSTILMMVTFYHAADDFSHATWLIDAEIVVCEQVSQYVAKEARKPPPTPNYRMNFSHPDTQKRIAEMLRHQPGVVLTVKIHQGAWIMERRWSWGAVTQRRGAWETVDKSEHIFADISVPVSRTSCKHFTLGERKLLALEWEKYGPGPSLKLPALLGLYVMRPVPPAHAKYAPAPKVAPLDQLDPPLDRSE